MSTWTDGGNMDKFGVPRGDRLLIRGRDTSLGQAGFCEACGALMPDGPDACLGYLAGVSHACCGHGGVCEAYVVIGGKPDEPLDHEYERTVLRGDDALKYFKEVLP